MLDAIPAMKIWNTTNMSQHICYSAALYLVKLNRKRGLSMFATLVGTNTESVEHEAIFEQLCEVANTHDFRSGGATLRIQPDQVLLTSWSLLLEGSDDEKADFLLAVTAPKVPSISPIPVRKTVSGLLFSVVVMDSFFGVWHQGDFSEFKDSEAVLKAFEGFLSSLPA